MIRIFHQRAKCIGCNACVEEAFFRWRISKKDGKCTLIGGRETRGGMFVAIVGDDELEENTKAAKSCPVSIIRIEIA